MEYVNRGDFSCDGNTPGRLVKVCDCVIASHVVRKYGLFFEVGGIF
jgi:hypothetical protein